MGENDLPQVYGEVNADLKRMEVMEAKERYLKKRRAKLRRRIMRGTKGNLCSTEKKLKK